MRNIRAWFTASAWFAVCIAVGSLGSPGQASAAATTLLKMYPAVAAVGVGADIPVGVFLTSGTYPVNSASAQMSFPVDKLEVVSVDKTNSIFDFWVQQPTFSNDNGTIRFGGIAFSPGFTGTLGKVLTIHFRAKAPGAANVRFVSDLILANDGKGTELPSDKSAILALTISATPPLVQATTTTPQDNLAQSLDNSEQVLILGRQTSPADIVLIALILGLIVLSTSNWYRLRKISTPRPKGDMNRTEHK